MLYLKNYSHGHEFLSDVGKVLEAFLVFWNFSLRYASLLQIHSSYSENKEENQLDIFLIKKMKYTCVACLYNNSSLLKHTIIPLPNLLQINKDDNIHNQHSSFAFWCLTDRPTDKIFVEQILIYKRNVYTKNESIILYRGRENHVSP